MYSKNDSTPVKEFMAGLGFPTFEDSEAWEKISEEYAGKEVTIENEGTQIVGTFHSLSMIFGSHINLTQVQQEKCTEGVLEALDYYHPKKLQAGA